MIEWRRNQQNRICFVMVDAAYTEVPGLGNTFTLQLSKNGGPFAPSGGTKAEIGNGWYTYLSTAGEADTVGPVAIMVTGAGCIQQNLEYTVAQRNPSAIEFTYTVTDSVTGLPIEGVEVWVALDSAPTAVIWNGDTDVAGVARDDLGNLPMLDPGTYRFYKQFGGYFDADAPYDTEIVS